MPRPVIERLLNEIIERHDQSPLIPQTDDNIGRGDLLDPAVLVLNGDRVFEANWLSHRQLNPGDEVAQNRLGGKTENHACYARRGKNTDAALAHRIERHQRKAQGHEHDYDVEDAHENADLSYVFARQ